MYDGPTVAIVDPNGSGRALSDAIAERGGHPVHVWRSQRRSRYTADPARHKLLHTSFSGTLTTLSELAPVAVLAGSEFGVNLANELAVALSLPSNDTNLATARRDKAEMLNVIAKAGLPVAKSYAVADESALHKALAELGQFPVIIKPKDSAGSDGCLKCGDVDEALRAFEALSGQVNYMGSKNLEILVQEFIDGPQYFIDTVSVDGHHILSDVFLYRIDNIASKPVIRNSILKVRLSDDEWQAVRYVLGCLDAVGVRNWAAHSEVRITAAGPRLIEVNSRLMGPVLHADPMVASLGYSQATLLADVALGTVDRLSSGLQYNPRRTLGHVMIRTRQTGTIRSMRGLSAIRRLPGFHSLANVPLIGTHVSPDNPLTTATTGLAYFVDDDYDQVKRSMDAVHAMEDAEQIFEVR